MCKKETIVIQPEADGSKVCRIYKGMHGQWTLAYYATTDVGGFRSKDGVSEAQLVVWAVANGFTHAFFGVKSSTERTPIDAKTAKFNTTKEETVAQVLKQLGEYFDAALEGEDDPESATVKERVSDFALWLADNV